MKKLYRFLLYALPVILYCSYFPILPLGDTDSMNLELSLPLIWLVIFVLVSAVLLLKQKPRISKKIFWILPFPFFLTCSIFWSSNPLRATLTVGILWLLLFAIIAIYYLRDLFSKEHWLRVFLISAGLISIWCWLQSILDLVGVDRSVTLMCQGCTTQMFGFPHPNGLAIEPQFMGNLLLAPVILALYLIMKKPSKKLITLAFFLLATLFLTFSRGAIYSFIVAIIILIIGFIIKNKNAHSLQLLPLIFLSFLFTLNMQGIFASLSNTNDTYFTGISKSLNQLSLGIIDIDFSEPETPNMERPEEEKHESTFDGYVEESTDVRLELSDQAFSVWKKDLKTILIGTGIGSAGNALYENNKTSSPKEIIQNEYVSLLLETGIIGLSLLIMALIAVIKTIIKFDDRIFFFALFGAFALSLLFFAGLPNALHIYLLPVFFTKEKQLVL